MKTLSRVSTLLSVLAFGACQADSSWASSIGHEDKHELTSPACYSLYERHGVDCLGVCLDGVCHTETHTGVGHHLTKRGIPFFIVEYVARARLRRLRRRMWRRYRRLEKKLRIPIRILSLGLGVPVWYLARGLFPRQQLYNDDEEDRE